MSIDETETGTRSATSGDPNGLTMQVVAETASPSVMFTGGQVRAKSRVNSYAFGAQAQISVPTSLSARAISPDAALESAMKETRSVAANAQLNRVLK
mmetsp:Transcript_23186/g.51618  ORF Transcript_23186/g.51618 Transcript_23186/m.51618 type:complete len:97 (+) Transcript_23186:1201-1491(+)